MPYVRKHGGQLALVHGVRHPETRKVEQQILFVFSSREEALDAAGEGREGSRSQFELLMENRFPGIKFDWTAIQKALLHDLEHLPVADDSRDERMRKRFVEALSTFTFELGTADPQALQSAAALVRDHRHQLTVLGDLISWRLKTCDVPPHDYTEDTNFGWRLALRSRQVPADVEELAQGYFERGELDRAEGAFKLLVDSFDDYADGHNYLGLIALRRERLDEAIRHFETTIDVGRRLFRRVAKRDWWSRLETRPYMRGLQNLAIALNRAGRIDDSLAIADRLEKECGDAESATVYRATAYLNAGLWRAAADAIEPFCEVWPEEGFLVAFARYHQGQLHAAEAHFLHACLNRPRAARIILGGRVSKPKGYGQVEDHNAGVEFRQNHQAYLRKHLGPIQRHFLVLLDSARFQDLLAEVESADAEAERLRGDAELSRAPWQRARTLRSLAFARSEVGMPASV